jgi:hypothetical protein
LDEEKPKCAGLAHGKNGFGSAKLRTLVAVAAKLRSIMAVQLQRRV